MSTDLDMVTFGSGFEDDKLYLSISDDTYEDPTKLRVYDPLVKGLAPQWPQLVNSKGGSWTQSISFGRGTIIVRHVLLSRHHSMSTPGTPFQMLKDRVASQEASWGQDLRFRGEIEFTKGYWEWTEDILSRCRSVLYAAHIFHAVRASLYTYDCNSDIIRLFCECWSPSTNTLYTTAGESSISLWDLYYLGGLPITGEFFDEVTPSAEELTGKTPDMRRRLPVTCDYLLHAFHLIYQGSANYTVSIASWIEFWCKVPSRYTAPPPRKEHKSSRRPTRTHNPTGELPRAELWGNKELEVFVKLNIPEDLRTETYLAAFISCWLCHFVLPSKALGLIRAAVFKMACFMARGEKVSLAIPVLSCIYRGLNTIAASATPGEATTNLPMHYVYAWIASYFNTHFSIKSKGPQMTKYSGEGGARYYEASEAYRRIYEGTLLWWSNKLDHKEPFRFIDRDNNTSSDTSHFLSIRSGYLPMRSKSSFIMQPYSPHRFARQFGFCQDIPGVARTDIRTTSLEEGLEHWRTFTVTGTTQSAYFPFHETRYRTTKGYDQWLKEAFLDKPQRQKVVRGRGKELRFVEEANGKALPSHGCSSVPKTASQTSSSDKRIELYADDRSDDNENQNFKHRRVTEANAWGKPPPGGDSFIQPISEILRGVGSLQSDEVDILGSFVGDSCDVADQDQPEQTSPLMRIDTPTAPFPQPVTASRDSPEPSVFVSSKFVTDAAREFVTFLWAKLCEKLKGRSVEQVLSMRDEVDRTIQDMKNISQSRLPVLDDALNSLFQGLQSFHDFQLHVGSTFTEEHRSKMLESTMARQESVNSQIEEKGKHLEVLQKRKRDICVLIEQEEAVLKSLRSDMSTLDGDITSLKNSKPLSREDEDKLNQMKRDLETQKDELGGLRLTF